jgi:tetratricopeptide (TPR) repeat protein
MKICVYGIAKNEEKFVARFMAGAAEADQVVILDTGSIDGTAERLRQLGAIVSTMEIQPFRFDVARNAALDLVPADVDICVSADLDEVLQPGWRAKLEAAWTPGTTRARYISNHLIDAAGRPIVQFYNERIHARQGYRWAHAVHEIIKNVSGEPEKVIVCPEIVFDHHPDRTKPRKFYIDLLRLDVQENPTEARCLFYLGRELMTMGHNKEAIDVLVQYLNSPTATWNEERGAARRYIARCQVALGQHLAAIPTLYAAMAETPRSRDPFVQMAFVAYHMKDWEATRFHALHALSLPINVGGYTNEPFSVNEAPYDLAAIACAALGRYREAVRHSTEALKINPTDERLVQNHAYYLSQSKGVK